MDNKEEYFTHDLGLALSGGGAKGFAHLGAMQALNDIGLFPSIISGTSAGAPLPECSMQTATAPKK